MLFVLKTEMIIKEQILMHLMARSLTRRFSFAISWLLITNHVVLISGIPPIPDIAIIFIRQQTFVPIYTILFLKVEIFGAVFNFISPLNRPDTVLGWRRCMRGHSPWPCLPEARYSKLAKECYEQRAQSRVTCQADINITATTWHFFSSILARCRLLKSVLRLSRNAKCNKLKVILCE